MSQCESILEHLRAGHALTPREAFMRFGTLALHSRIAELREQGHDIVCRVVRDGQQKWGEYRLCAVSPA